MEVGNPTSWFALIDKHSDGFWLLAVIGIAAVTIILVEFANAINRKK